MSKNNGSNLQVRLPEDSFDDQANEFNQNIDDEGWEQKDEDEDDYEQAAVNNKLDLKGRNDPGRPAGPPTLP